MLYCNQCGNEMPGNMRFCTECGAAVGQGSGPIVPRTMPLSTGGGTATAPATMPPVAAPLGSLRPASGPLGDDFDALAQAPVGGGQLTAGLPSQTNIKALIGIVGGLAVVAVAAAVYFALNHSPAALAAASLKSALESGRLVTLTSDDAYTSYHQVKALDPNNKILAQVAPHVLSRLRSLADELFTRQATAQIANQVTYSDWQRAVRAFEWARELDPSDQTLEAWRLFAMGQVAEGQRRLGEAENDYEAAGQILPSWAMVQNSLGVVRAEKKDRWNDAVQCYQRAIQLKPGWEFPYNNMGSVYRGRKDYQSAEYWYRQAIEKNPRWARPHWWLGVIYESQHLKEAAIGEYQTAIALDPNSYSIKVEEIQKKISKLQR